MKTNKWIFAIMIASVAWVSCDDDDDNPLTKPDLNETDESFVEIAARSNMAEIEFGELAATKATDTLVKAFAQEMVNAHTTAQNELEDLADDYRNIDWPNDLSEGHDSIMAKLDEASGYSFDTLYMRTQIAMHEDAVQHFETGTTASTDARVKAYATKYLPKIEMHLDHADSVQTAVINNNTATATGTDAGTTEDGTTDDGTGTDDGTTDDGTTTDGTN